MRFKTKLVYVGLLLVFSLACSPKTESTPAVTETKPAIEAPLSWQQEWDGLSAKSKKEGQLVIFTSMEEDVIGAIASAFQNKFNIKVETQAGRGPEILPKILAQRKANLYLVDLYIGGTDPILFTLKPAEALTPIKPYLFLPEVLNPELWYGKALPWVDNEKQWILQTKGGPEGGDMVINTNLVREGELTSYQDFLQPNWKGKMNLTDPTVAGRGRRWFGTTLYYKNLDLDYMRALAKQEPFLTRDKRLQIEWVAKGKHLVSLLNAPSVYYDFRDAGASIKEIYLKESKVMLGGGSSGLSAIGNPLHPNAARLFVNWYLSKEGQTAFTKAYMYQSFREDVATEHLLSAKIRKPGSKYEVESEDFLRNISQYDKLASEIFGPLIK